MALVKRVPDLRFTGFEEEQHIKTREDMGKLYTHAISGYSRM